MFLANPYCHGPMTCGITDTQTTAWAFAISFPLSNKFTADFTAGVSGGITYTSTTARAVTKSVVLKEKECGYFTWIPILKESWLVFETPPQPILQGYQKRDSSGVFLKSETADINTAERTPAMAHTMILRRVTQKGSV